MSDLKRDQLLTALESGDLTRVGELLAAQLDLEGDEAQAFATQWAENYRRSMSGPGVHLGLP